LICLAKISESTKRCVQVFAIPKAERIESTSRQVKQLVALHVTYGTQFATPAPSFSKQTGGAVTPAVGKAREVDRNKIDALEIMRESLRIVCS
jgi:hypothetical protein